MASKSISGFSPAAMSLDALSVGFWEDDVEADRVRGDAAMARLFGLSASEVAEGITRERLVSIFHPEDWARDVESRRRVREDGGLFVWEHRIVPPHGRTRWVLARGRFERDTNGRMFGRGIVVDVTDSRLEWHAGPSSQFQVTPEASDAPLERVAACALEAWERLRDMDGEDEGRLRPLIEALLLETARQIARSLTVGHTHSLDPKLH